MGECEYGEKCYRKNPKHIAEYHPEKMKQEHQKDKEQEHGRKKGETEKKGKITGFFGIAEGPVRKKRRQEDDKEEKAQGTSKQADTKQTVKRGKAVADKWATSRRGEKRGDSDVLPSPFLPHHPDTFHFWRFAQSLNEQDPCGAFCSLSGARLCGVFEWLAAGAEAEARWPTDHHRRLLGRTPTDLPEMQPVIHSHHGRYCLWRDDPAEFPAMIVFVDGKPHFPSFQIVGKTMEHAIAHLLGKNPKAADVCRFLPSGDVSGYTKAMTATVAERKKLQIGRPLHGLGVRVPMRGDLGYRPVPEQPDRLRKTLDVIGTTSDEYVREKKMEKVMEIVTYVQFANDECDFGMGLELGHSLFVSGYGGEVGEMAERMLTTAYMLLDRCEFGSILEAQCHSGRFREE